MSGRKLDGVTTLSKRRKSFRDTAEDIMRQRPMGNAEGDLHKPTRTVSAGRENDSGGNCYDGGRKYPGK